METLNDVWNLYAETEREKKTGIEGTETEINMTSTGKKTSIAIRRRR